MQAIVRLGGSSLQAECDLIKDLKITSSIEIDTIKCQLTSVKEELKQHEQGMVLQQCNITI